MAALRHARAGGFDDVIYLSSEGEVLEGPRSTVVIAGSGELLSPPTEVGILEGTTLGALAELAPSEGDAVRRERLLLTHMPTADPEGMLSPGTRPVRVPRNESHGVD